MDPSPLLLVCVFLGSLVALLGLFRPFLGFLVFLIVHFGTLLPNAPGNAGVYQFFCVLGLTLFGLPKTAAAGFSIVVYVLLEGPTWLIGFLVLAQNRLKIASIRKDIENFLKT